MKRGGQGSSQKAPINSTRRVLIANARGRAPMKYAGLYRLKAKANLADLFAVFPDAVRTEGELADLHGPAFPASINNMFSRRRLGNVAPILNELVWAISSSLIHAVKISEFGLLRAAYERALLEDDRDGCSALLDEIERVFGWSLWLVQNRLAIVQIRDGIDEKRRLARIYEERVSGRNVLGLLVNFISRRCEGTTVPGYLQGELSRLFPDGAVPALEAYLRTKLFDLASPAISSIAATLSYESQASAIDYYETLIALLQAVAADESFPEEMAAQLAKPLVVLYRRVGDARLLPVMIALVGVFEPPSGHGVLRAPLIEAYSEGRYADVLAASNQYLAEFPEDISAFVICLRAEMKAGHAPRIFPGVLGEVAESLREVFALSPDAYGAAFSLLTLFERYYGHAWAIYVRAVVMHELAQEQSAFPAASLRTMYAVDQHLTPFTRLLARECDGSNVTNYLGLERLFPSTTQVYDLVIDGIPENAFSISEERKNKYLGRYNLTRGNYAAAIENFRWIQENQDGADALRGGTGAAVAYLKSGDRQSAVQTLVSSYDRWPHVPTVLPLLEVVQELDSPLTWPNTIALPLTFELYASFFRNDKLSHLKYAFERFQTTNQISSPADLLTLQSEVDRGQMIQYLDRVWRPEVMRQTVLYENTKDIEDARIKVCRFLSEIDPDNSARYFSEIRERVKQQEIAKATSLVAQSKVYVDIGAIKKALRTKLGDAYARYKTAVQATPVAIDPMVENITDLLSSVQGGAQSLTKVLSDLHVLMPEATNELDVQFAAMFSEVTNEFLRGDQGLNSYLSTRVRHGKLSNALRKAVADEHLVTERKEGAASYVKNDHWTSELSDLDAETLKLVLDALEAFAFNFDKIVAYVRDELIQIAVIHELVDSGAHPRALFEYRSSNLERKFVQAYDRKIKVIDEFIDRCIETLWEKTDENLVHVQHVLNTTIRAQLLGAFDRLTDSLATVPAPARLGGLVNHIARARTNTQNSLALVASWFKRSEVYDRQDYAPDFPVLVATNMVTSTISGTASWQGVKVRSEPGSPLMPGRTLDGMVDIFCGLLENAIAHSSLSIEELTVDVVVKLSEGAFSATIENATADAISHAEAEHRLAKLRDEIKKSDSPRKAQLEGRSGFHKLWATINAPQYREPTLDFGFGVDGTFKVTVGFKIGTTDDDNTAD